MYTFYFIEELENENENALFPVGEIEIGFTARKGSLTS